jgi:hypothetical protein
MEVPQKYIFLLKEGMFPLWPTYIEENKRTLGKTYGIKARCYWEHPWHIYWEPDGNPLGI